jgi:hypothetical protein
MLAYWYALRTGYWYELDTCTSTLHENEIVFSSEMPAYWYAVGNYMNSDMLVYQYAQRTGMQ